MKKKYLVVAPGYPSLDNIYNNGFVHARVRQYTKKGLKLDVFSVTKEPGSYMYEGQNVITGGYNELSNTIASNTYDKIIIHFGWKKIVQTILTTKEDAEILMWIHGVEALGWYRRLFLLDPKQIHKFFGYMFLNIRQILFMRSLILDKKANVTFVFVSNWMKDILEKDTLTKGKIKDFTIIPNVIDESIFKYKEKKQDDRLNILSIRPYASKKYANDISVQAVLKLSKKPYFDKLSFSFYGDGKLFDKTLLPLRKFNNIKIHKGFLKQKEIASMHKKNGVMLIPTRQDAQGVSMCEAMSSGLVPITSDNTAIPEFVNSKCGYLTNNSPEEIANAIEDLYKDSSKYIKMSPIAASHIRDLCSTANVIDRELSLIRKA